MTKEKEVILLDKIIIIFGIVVIMLAIYGFGFQNGRNKIKKSAIENNAAEYQVNAKTGKTKFVWKSIK